MLPWQVLVEVSEENTDSVLRYLADPGPLVTLL